MITGITFGTWDLLHAGHLFLFKKAKEQCDEFIVCLHIDPNREREYKNKPVESIFERWMRLEGCKYVDKVIPYETEEEIFTMLEFIKPNKRFLGTEYLDKDFTGKNICNALGIEVVYIDRHHDYSSSSLRKKIEDAKK